MTRLLDAARERHDRLQAEAAEALPSPRVAAAVAALAALGPPDDAEAQARLQGPAIPFAAATLGRLDRRFRRRGRDFEDMDEEQRHQLRLLGKKLRYASEWLHPLFGQRRGRAYVTRLRAVQTLLGRLQDAHAAAGIVAELRPDPDDPARRRMEKALRRRTRDLEAQWDATWEAFARRERFWKQ